MPSNDSINVGCQTGLAMIIFLFLGPMGFLPVFMDVSPSDPMDIHHDRHGGTKSCSPLLGVKVKAKVCAHINILGGT